ncbi:hypothetical protein [Vibrio sp. OPT18]|uniref:hypothetical protein n=1 Tax=Vibrio sp. OPT18 TaxID=2778641 RepID=UPI00187F370A|nr:hypothetical protein [Vibrio sp. OPT18]MBE8578657.1 hypothetical protein [Vibrio sp. OPT18]
MKDQDKIEEQLPVEIDASDDAIIAQCILKHDICPLKTPIKFNSKTYDCLIRVRRAKVGDRIQAVKWSIDQYDGEFMDAVRAHLLSEICEFGTLVLEREEPIKTKDKTKNKDVITIKSARLKDEPVTLPVDTIIDMMDVGDYVNASYLMGKN